MLDNHSHCLFGDSHVERLSRGAHLSLSHKRLPGWLNTGIGGDRAEHLNWRLEQGGLPRNLKTAVICVGSNNLRNGNNNCMAIANTIIKSTVTIADANPAAKIIVIGILPRENISKSRAANTVNDILRFKLSSCITFVSPPDALTVGGGPNPVFFEKDRKGIMVHLNRLGYKLLLDTLAPFICTRGEVSHSPTQPYHRSSVPDTIGIGELEYLGSGWNGNASARASFSSLSPSWPSSPATKVIDDFPPLCAPPLPLSTPVFRYRDALQSRPCAVTARATPLAQVVSLPPLQVAAPHVRALPSSVRVRVSPTASRVSLSSARVPPTVRVRLPASCASPLSPHVPPPAPCVPPALPPTVRVRVTPSASRVSRSFASQVSLPTPRASLSPARVTPPPRVAPSSGRVSSPARVSRTAPCVSSSSSCVSLTAPCVPPPAPSGSLSVSRMSPITARVSPPSTSVSLLSNSVSPHSASWPSASASVSSPSTSVSPPTSVPPPVARMCPPSASVPACVSLLSASMSLHDATVPLPSACVPIVGGYLPADSVCRIPPPPPSGQLP